MCIQYLTDNIENLGRIDNTFCRKSFDIATAGVHYVKDIFYEFSIHRFLNNMIHHDTVSDISGIRQTNCHSCTGFHLSKYDARPRRFCDIYILAAVGMSCILE